MANPLEQDNQAAIDAAEAKHERMRFITSLPEETRDKALSAMEGMNDQQQAQVWDRMRENSNQQQDQQNQR